MRNIVRIFLNEKKVTEEKIRSGWELMAGRGMSSRIISVEVNPKSDPFGPDNKIVFAPGLFAGTNAS